MRYGFVDISIHKSIYNPKIQIMDIIGWIYMDIMIYIYTSVIMDGLWILLDGSNLWMYLITVLVAMMNLIYGYWSMDLYIVLSIQIGMLANMSHQKKEIGSTCYVVIMFFSHMLLIYGMGLNWTNTLWHRYFRNQPWFCFNSKEDRIGRIEFGKVSNHHVFLL